MRICYVVSTFPRREDDPEVPWMLETARRLKEKGMDIEIFAPSFKGLKSHRIFGIKVHRFRYFPKRWEDLTHDEGAPNKIGGLRFKVASFFYILFGTIGLVRLCTRRRFDILHIHWPFPHGIFGYFGSNVWRSRIVLNFYGAELFLMNKFGFVRPVLKWLIRDADEIVAVSSFTAEKVRNIYEKKVNVIPYGSAILERGYKEGSSRKKKILFVGRLIERKGVEYLIRAVGLLRREKLNVKLTVVGSGHERPALEKVIEDEGLQETVELAGRVPDEELAEHYQTCDVFVLPSIVDSKGDTEGLGVVLLEAMSYKKPVVASDVGGIRDVIKDGRTGILVPQKDPEALAKAIRRVLEDEVLAHRLGECGYRFAKENFDWEGIIKKLRGVYEGLVVT